MQALSENSLDLITRIDADGSFFYINPTIEALTGHKPNQYLNRKITEVGLNEEVVLRISQKKKEPEWMTQWRLKAYQAWKEMDEPDWANVQYSKPDYQAISYYSAPCVGLSVNPLVKNVKKLDMHMFRG